jgi:uncharacterized membrane protein SpoIIM required for sporulation
VSMDIDTFVNAREHRWRRLEELVDAAETLEESELGRERLLELVNVYRLACTDLNRLRSLTANPALLGRVNQLVGRAYRFVYRQQPRRPAAGALRRFLLIDVPATFRREERWVLSSAAAMFAGILMGFFAVLANPDNATALVPPAFFSESPQERVARIEKDPERIDNAQKATTFGAFLYTHNIRVSFLGFSLGALTIVMGWVLMFYNGLLLGAIAAQYMLDGVGTFFVAWVGPHGALELPAFVFAGAAGLRAGAALLLPGELGRAEAVRQAFPSVWRMVLTSALLLVMAGAIEGSFSQLSSKSVPYPLKIAVAIALFSAMIFWLFVGPRLGSHGEGGERP